MSEPRSATGMTAAALAGLHLEAFPDNAWPEAYWASAMTDARLRLRVIGPAEAPTGLLLTQHVLDEVEILTLGVVAAARRRGLGAQLIADLLQDARATDAADIFLEVEANNLAARALYALAGFAVIGLRRDYYGPGRDALRMQRQLRVARGD